MAETGAVPRLWDRSRQAAREEIERTALRLFTEQGFDATTIDQIVAEVGISRRSFFRYFGTKEDIVLGDLVAVGRTLRDALAARPAEEDPWSALRAAFLAMAAHGPSPERRLTVMRLMLTSSSLRARHLEKHLQWQGLLVPLLEQRLGVDAGAAPDPRARALVSAALGCLDTALEVWTLRDGEADPVELYDQAVAAVRG
ncbi:TetR family transcriptional regulator [Microlunatus lacustris]